MVMVIITFANLHLLTVDVTHYHIRNSGVFIAFTFSEELGFGEGGHVLELSLLNLYLVTSGQLVNPHTLFMVD